MNKVLVISGHPNLEESYTNTVILKQLQADLDNLEVRKLDKLYPNYQIDIKAEQNALLEADIVVLQFPFYWYSVPALLKKWIDDVFAYDFAYGSRGDKLKGKQLILSFTVGGPAESYDPLGYNHFPIEELIKPLKQTAYLAEMELQPAVYSHSMVYIPNVYNTQEQVEESAQLHSSRLVDTIKKLQSSEESLIKQFIKQWFALMDQLPEQSGEFIKALANDFKMQMPEGDFLGEPGFLDWYQLVKQTFKANCEHIIEQINIEKSELGYQVKLRVRLKADSYESSSFKGEQVNLLVNENWQLQVVEQQVKIHQYQVKLIN